MKVEVEPIRDEETYRRGLAELETLWGSATGTPEGDKLDVLLDLVESYERKHYPVPPPEPVDAIRFAMDQRGLKPVQLSEMFGSTARVYEVLSGKRKLSLNMIRALHRGLGIPLESLIGE
jgi:HTH-type transcriptional regulator / antitoxin HigA